MVETDISILQQTLDLNSRDWETRYALGAAKSNAGMGPLDCRHVAFWRIRENFKTRQLDFPRIRLAARFGYEPARAVWESLKDKSDFLHEPAPTDKDLVGALTRPEGVSLFLDFVEPKATTDDQKAFTQAIRRWIREQTLIAKQAVKATAVPFADSSTSHHLVNSVWGRDGLCYGGLGMPVVLDASTSESAFIFQGLCYLLRLTPDFVIRHRPNLRKPLQTGMPPRPD